MSDKNEYTRQELIQMITDIADHYGADAQIDQTLEELAELAMALHHYKKHPESESIMNNICEEIADVCIMLLQLEYLLRIDEETWKQLIYKVKRQKERISQEQPNKNSILDRMRWNIVIRRLNK